MHCKIKISVVNTIPSATNPENCSALLRIYDPSSINFDNLGLKTDADLSSVSYGWIESKFFDVDCSAQNSFIWCKCHFKSFFFICH